jgi:hypothetical protein
MKKVNGVADYEPQVLANLLNGFARLDHHPGPTLLQLIVHRCIQLLLQQQQQQQEEEEEGAAASSAGQGFKPQELSNLLNGLARLNFHPGKELLDLVAHTCEHMGLQAFKPQEVASLINAYARFNFNPGEVR